MAGCQVCGETFPEEVRRKGDLYCTYTTMQRIEKKYIHTYSNKSKTRPDIKSHGPYRGIRTVTEQGVFISRFCVKNRRFARAYFTLS